MVSLVSAARDIARVREVSTVLMRHGFGEVVTRLGLGGQKQKDGGESGDQQGSSAKRPSLAARIPRWAWTGGLFGAISIALAILLVPKLGAAAFIALLVTGQMLASLAFDLYGLLGLARRSMDLPRLLGVVLLLAGVVLIRR